MQKQSPTINKNAVEVKDLSVFFDNYQVLNKISFSIKQGTITAIIGPNGSGKTTLLRTILGLVKPETGEIKILNQPLHHVHKSIGYVPQKFDFERTFPITVKEFLLLALHKEGKKKLIDEAIKDVGLKPSTQDKRLGVLSGGQLQRVLIAQAILNKPSILFLDEPSTGIDLVAEATFYEVIKHLNEKHGTTIILVSHDIGMIAENVEQIICINKKLICYGSPKKTLSKKNLKKIFGGEVNIHKHHQH